MAKVGYQHGYDILTWNYRGCSEEMNKTLGFYHSGATHDLATVLQNAQETGQYKEIFLIAFSLGGNLTLKYLGEERTRPASLKKAVAFSVPMDLHTSCNKISQPSNWVYSQRFVKSLKEKIIRKSKTLRELDVRGLDKIKTLREFDDYFTGPIHGFKDALDYYDHCSAIRFVTDIKIPVLVISAANDPFLSPECYPHDLLRNHPYVSFESPQRGGHVGFAQFNKNGLYWSEQRAIEFLNR